MIIVPFLIDRHFGAGLFHISFSGQVFYKDRLGHMIRRGEHVDTDIVRFLPERLRERIRAYGTDIYELRLHRGGSVAAITKNSVKTLGTMGDGEFRRVFSELCGGAPYAFENEIRQGYFTVKGCRIGVCGSAVVENGAIISVKDVRSLNLRFAHEVKGCADVLLDSLGGSVSGGLLIAGPPACGKTTLLRDLARQLSENGRKVCLIDERGELAAVADGVPAADVGPLTDVLDGYPKIYAADLAMRCLSPDIIVCDEIGEGETDAVVECADCGIDVVAAVHGNERSRRFLRLAESGCFRYGAFFKAGAVGVIERVISLADA